jgi:hypothetical protein
MDSGNISNLNNQLADLTKDWERHQDAQHQYTNPDQQRKNEQITAARQFIPPSTTPPIAHPSVHNYPAAPSGLSQPPQTQPSRAIYQQPAQQLPTYQQQPTPQIIQTPTQQSQITAGHYQQLPQQVRQLPQQTDPRDTMNERMGNFRFDHAGSTYGMPGLVPVNMDHIYSGNLFSDGLPVPQDLRDQFTLSAPGATKPGARIQHQTKGKTMYRADNNERLAALSPLGRALYYPVSGQGQHTSTQHMQPSYGPSWDSSSQYQHQSYQQQQIDYTSSGLARPQQTVNNHPAMQPQFNTRRSELRADINSRIGQIPSLAAASSPEAQYINMGSEPYGARPHNPTTMMGGTQPKKVVYQDMYPVMSK